MDISNIRKDFDAHPPLKKEDMDANPFIQFTNWFQETLDSGIAEPNAFVLSTSVDNHCTQRGVLLKYFDEDGFVFFTNYGSNKAKEIEENPYVSMLFPWFSLQRQIHIKGKAEKISRAQSLKYFLSRPKDSQIGAWSSAQSHVIDSRALLINQWHKLKEKFANGEVPLPDFWGGYRISGDYFEFWQGQPSRLHDRFCYSKNEHQDWIIKRLAP